MKTSRLKYWIELKGISLEALSNSTRLEVPVIERLCEEGVRSQETNNLFKIALGLEEEGVIGFISKAKELELRQEKKEEKIRKRNEIRVLREKNREEKKEIINELRIAKEKARIEKRSIIEELRILKTKARIERKTKIEEKRKNKENEKEEKKILKEEAKRANMKIKTVRVVTLESIKMLKEQLSIEVDSIDLDNLKDFKEQINKVISLTAKIQRHVAELILCKI